VVEDDDDVVAVEDDDLAEEEDGEDEVVVEEGEDEVVAEEDLVVCCWNALAAATETPPVSVTAPTASHRLIRETSASPRLRAAGPFGAGSVARGFVVMPMQSGGAA
jgi:hypothetical protein